MSTVITEVKADPQAARTQDAKTQAETKIDPTIKVAQEAGDIRTSVVTRMIELWKAVGRGEDSLSKGLIADAVAGIIPVLGLPEKIRPKYATIGDMILEARGRHVVAMSQYKLPDGSMEMRPPKQKKPNAYRQQATPYVAMARWEAGLWNAAEKKHRDRNPGLKVQITHNNELYTSPVAAMKAGVAPLTVYRLFANVVSPRFVDTSKMFGTKAEGLGKQQAKKVKVKYRTVEDGKVEVSATPVAGNRDLTVGMILGLLDETPEFSNTQFDKLNVALEAKRPKAAPTA